MIFLFIILKTKQKLAEYLLDQFGHSPNPLFKSTGSLDMGKFDQTLTNMWPR